MSTRDDAKRELTETARMLLDAIVAERRMVELPPTASVEEAAKVLVDAEDLRERAMSRFKVMCARLACAVKTPLGTTRTPVVRVR